MSDIKYIEPYETISWAAYHLFSPEFHEKWQSGLLSFSEFKKLIALTICHVETMLERRNWFEPKLKKYDKGRLQMLKAIRQGLCLTAAEAREYENKINYSDTEDGRRQMKESRGFAFVHQFFNWAK